MTLEHSMNLCPLNLRVAAHRSRFFGIAVAFLTALTASAEVGSYPWTDLNIPVSGRRYVYTGTATNVIARTTDPIQRVLEYSNVQTTAEGLRFDLADRVASTVDAGTIYYDYQESHLFHATSGEQLLSRTRTTAAYYNFTNGNDLNVKYTAGPMAPSLFAQGQTYTYSVGFDLGSTTGSERRRVTVSPLETVAVPAGTFRCVVISVVVDYPSSFGLGIVGTGATYWYARNVGVVKVKIAQKPTIYALEYDLQSTNFALAPGAFDETLRIAAEPENISVAVGEPARLRVVAEGANLSYQWSYNGSAIPGANQATYTIPAAAFSDQGTYQVKVTGPSASLQSKAAVVTVAPALSGTPGKLVNVSVRAYARNAGQTLIAGLAVEGNATAHRVLARALGPSLRQFGVSTPCLDPSLSVRNNGGVSIGENDDWGNSADPAALVRAAQSVGAFPLTSGTRDAAQLVSLTAGNYTALASDAGGGTAVVECYDMDANLGGGFANLSARADTTLAPLIVGWVIDGQIPVKVLVRAVGPSLAQFGITGVAANPRVQVYGQNCGGANNDAWSNSAQLTDLRAAFKAVGAFTLLENSQDTALIATLSPGSYSAVVDQSSVGGVALIEIYRLP